MTENPFPVATIFSKLIRRAVDRRPNDKQFDKFQRKKIGLVEEKLKTLDDCYQPLGMLEGRWIRDDTTPAQLRLIRPTID